MSKTAANQKLTDQQIQDLKKLKSRGVRVSLLAKVISLAEGVAISATYYHLSDNRDPYCNRAKKQRAAQREKVRQRIHTLIQEGYTTGEIAQEWNTDLALLNKIYTS